MLLLIDKPKGITSHDVVDEVRKVVDGSPAPRLRRTKVGHAGTLDPNATGLLIVGVGRQSTKKLGEIAKGTTKTYIAEIFLGESRDTDDVEGKLIIKSEKLKTITKISKLEIENTLKQFEGEQDQVPPAHSAIKIRGKKAYQLARKGMNLNLSPRNVTIHSIKLLKYDYPILKIETKVSSGTYIRALARDIGKALGTGAYLKNLRRTRIGEYDIKDSTTLDKLSVVKF